MRKQDFYGLSRSIQDRFIESSQGAAAPAPLAVVTRKENISLLWGIGSLLTAGAWAFFTTYGFGDLRSPFALASFAQRLIHVGFAALTAFCAFRAYTVSWGNGRLQYAPGTYLFPSGVVDARFGELTEYDATEITGVEAQGSKLLVLFSSQKFTFPFASAEQANAVADKAKEAIEKWKAVSDGAPLERARLSPLVDSGIHNPLAPTQAHRRPQLLGVVPLVILALVLGAGAGFGVSIWRDSLSQKALFKAAVQENSIEAYQAYIDRGGDREEVKTLLLPRAELERAVAAGSVESIQGFLKKNPNTEISGEVQNALRAALLRELEAVKQKGSLTALDAFLKQYPDHSLIAGEINAARRQIYAKAMADFQVGAATVEEGLVAYVQQLLTWAETHGPVVQLRFSQSFPQDRKMLDQIVSKSKKYYMGQKSLPTQYFLGERARAREKAFLEAVQKRLQAAFSPDLVRFEIAPPVSAENEDLPEAEVPAITFHHQEKLSGGYVGGKPKAMYMGVAVSLSAEATIPGKPDNTLKFTWNAWKNPNFSILVDSSKDMPDVYEDMMGGAFDKYRELYLQRWFVQP